MGSVVQFPPQHLADVQDHAGSKMADRLIGRLLVTLCAWLKSEGRSYMLADMIYEIEALQDDGDQPGAQPPIGSSEGGTAPHRQG